MSTFLHGVAVFRTLLSVNWIRYKAGRKYPIPIKFVNNDLNDNFRKGAYIRRQVLARSGGVWLMIWIVVCTTRPWA